MSHCTTTFKYLAITLMVTACAQTEDAGSEPLAPPSTALANLAGFAGEYVIVDARRASDVAAPLQPMSDNPIGETIRFHKDGIDIAGLSCDSWRIEARDLATIPIAQDPVLSDLMLAPIDGDKSRGDQRENTAFDLLCEQEVVGQIHKVDDRTLVLPWQNSSLNLILERPLPDVQIKTYQAQLKSMKFYDGDLTGELDSATLSASRAWYSYRADESLPIPLRPAITENLLDGLGVLHDRND
jgi:hypothetical protein